MASLDLEVEVSAASWTGRPHGSSFINSPITNLDVSAVLRARSDSIFLLAEPKSPPEREWTFLPESSRGGERELAVLCGLRAVTKLIFSRTKKLASKPGAQ